MSNSNTIPKLFSFSASSSLERVEYDYDPNLTEEETEVLKDFILENNAILQETGSPVPYPFLNRFPNQNKSNLCWASFVEFNECRMAGNTGKDIGVCFPMWKTFNAYCPSYQVAEWHEAMEKGVMPGFPRHVKQ